MTFKTTKILGLDFFDGSLQSAISVSKQGGLFTFPSGPGLSALDKDLEYQKALESSDYIITDSGFMVLIWCHLLRHKAINRISGYLFFKSYIQALKSQEAMKVLWVMPGASEMRMNLDWLRNQGISVEEKNCYIAPFYKDSPVEDTTLLERAQTEKPDAIIINIGGGPQEKLGAYLKKHLDHKPTILCTGAAIGFLSGTQPRIPMWADALYLGWLFRIIQSPKRFLIRYWKAFRLAYLLIRFRESAPTAS